MLVKIMFCNHAVVVCMDESGGWDNIKQIKQDGSAVAIVFGGGSPFKSDNN